MTTLTLRRMVKSDAKAFFDAIFKWPEQTTTSNGKAYLLCPMYDGHFFVELISLLRGREKGEKLPKGRVPDIFLAAFVDKEMVGRLSLRPQLSPRLKVYGGHIGYAVSPEHRRKGYATEMLKQVLPICHELGLKKVMLTTDVDNVGSYKAIEKNGGVLEDVFRDEENGRVTRRYIINICPYCQGDKTITHHAIWKLPNGDILTPSSTPDTLEDKMTQIYMMVFNAKDYIMPCYCTRPGGIKYVGPEK